MVEIFVGTVYNQILTVPLFSNDPIQAIGPKKRSKIMHFEETQDSMFFANDETIYRHHKQSNETEILAYSTPDKKIIGCFAYHDSDFIHYCLSSGEIVELRENSQEQVDGWKKLIMFSSNSKNYQKSIYNNENLICMFGKGVLPFTYDFNIATCTWKAKNVPNDQLDLEVPIDDTDGTFLNLNTLALTHAFQKVRLYDVRGQRRKPTLDAHLPIEKVKLTNINKSPCENYLYVGNSCGSIYELDCRKDLSITKKYKGIGTSITDLLVTDSLLIASSLDSYVRIFNRESRQIKVKKYLNVHPTIIKLLQNQKYSIESLFKVEEVNLEEEEEVEKVKKVKQIRKRNKVGLKYLQPRSLDVKLQQGYENDIQ